MTEEKILVKIITDEDLVNIKCSIAAKPVVLIPPVPGKSIQIVKFDGRGIFYKLVDAIKTEYAPGGKLEIKYEKDEIIKIKLAQYQEMLECKDRIEQIEKYLAIMEIKPNFNAIYERVDQLEAKQKFLEANWMKIDRLDKQQDEMDDRVQRLEVLEALCN